MTLYEYILLRPEEQANATWKFGAFIALADKGSLKVLLYQIDSFYVEVYYNCELGKIEEFRSFDSTDQLEPYLSAIDLSELIAVARPTHQRPTPPAGLRSRIWHTLYRLFP
ncbi:MAG TPA: hypothetical protein VGE66_14435 [Chitinophagaceae bacterium]